MRSGGGLSWIAGLVLAGALLSGCGARGALVGGSFESDLPPHVGISVGIRLGEVRAYAGFDTTEVVLSPVGEADAQPMIQRAIDGLPEGGGTVRLRAGTYLVDRPISIARSGVRLVGAGVGATTVRFRSGAMGGRILDVIEVAGQSAALPARMVHIAGLTIDANYWEQPGSYNPRGIDTDNAEMVLVEDVLIDRAFVGLTFGMNVERATAHRVTVTRWHNDAFNASGDGETGGVRDVVFSECVARGSFNERMGGLPGLRNNAWEIEDGAADVTLVGCVVQNCSGNGFGVRNHSLDGACTTGPVTLVDCRAENVGGNAFFVIGNAFPNNVGPVTLIRCSTDSVSTFTKGVRGLSIEDSVFGGTASIGPARDVVVRASVFENLTVWSFPVDVAGNDAASYETRVTLERIDIEEQLSVFGDPRGVRLIDTLVPSNANLPSAAARVH